METLLPSKQAEVLDFMAFLKARQSPADSGQSRTVEAIESFFRGFDVDVSGYRFDREEAHAR